MATSSIFKDFAIKDQESANNFFRILLDADKDESRKTYEPSGVETLEGEAFEKWFREKWRNQ